MTGLRADELPELLTVSEVATMFRVDPKTVGRWAKAGRIKRIQTLGGHGRFYAAEVRGLLSWPEQAQEREAGQ